MDKKLVISLALLCLLLPEIGKAQGPTTLIQKEEAEYFNKNPVSMVFNSDDIENSGAQSLSQFLNQSGAAQVNTLYGDDTYSVINMRSTDDSAYGNTLILLDGVPLNPANTTSLNLNIIPLTAIEKIIISRQSAGVLYGDQAVGGTVNIITKAPERITKGAKMLYGSYNSKNLIASLGDGLKNGFSYLINGGHSDSNGYRQHNKMQNNNVAGSFAYNDDKDNITFNLYVNNQHLDLPGPIFFEEMQEDPTFSDNNSAFSNQKETTGQLLLKRMLSTNWQLDVALSDQNAQTNNNLVLIEDNYNFVGKKKIRSFIPQITGNINLFQHELNVVGGYQYLGSSFDLDGVLVSESIHTRTTENENSFYAQASLPIKYGITATAGARTAQVNFDFDPQKISNRATVSEFGLVWKKTQNLAFSLRAAGSYRLPKIDEEAFTFGQNPLQTQTGMSYEGVVKWLADNYSLNFSLYKLLLKNEIVVLPLDAGLDLHNTLNLDPTVRNGMDIAYSTNLTSKWKLAVLYSYVNATFRSGPYSGKDIPFVARNIFTMSNIYQMNEHWHVGIESLFTGRRYPVNDFENQDRIVNSTFLQNFVIGFSSKAYSINLRINNFTGQKYPSYATVRGAEDLTAVVYYPAPKVNFMLDCAIALD